MVAFAPESHPQKLEAFGKMSDQFVNKILNTQSDKTLQEVNSKHIYTWTLYPENFMMLLQNTANGSHIFLHSVLKI